jgi:hypothetical protein
MSVAEANQVLLTASAFDVAEPALRGQSLEDVGPVSFACHGPYSFKGIKGPLDIFEVAREGHVARRPPADSGKARRCASSNLPAPLSRFIGRAAEKAAVVAAVGKSRLVTLVGAGGIGKTRLALAAAGELVGVYPQGLWFVDLARVSDPASVPRAVLEALELREETRRLPVAVLIDHLRSRRVIV